jgi:large subunit ribosomal protein L25
MEKVELEAKKREKTGTIRSRESRSSGFIPAIVYGRGTDPIAVEVENKKFKKIISSKAGHNVIITLKISGDGKTQNIPVLAHEIARNYLKDSIIHVDFFKINMEEEIKVKVPVILHGESIGVKLDGGILVQGLREVEIKCLPENIPDKFDVDVSQLKIGAGLHVSDLKIEKGITILIPSTEILVSISAPAKEEVVVAPLEAPEVTGQAVPPAAGVAAPGAAAVAGKEAAPAGKATAPAAKAAAPAAKEASPEAKKK